MNNSNIFYNCSTLEEAKKLYRREAMRCHPDHNGSAEEFTKLKAQFDEWLNDNGNSSDTAGEIISSMFEEFPEFARHVQNFLSRIPPELLEIDGLSDLLGAINNSKKTKGIIRIAQGAFNLLKLMK